MRIFAQKHSKNDKFTKNIWYPRFLRSLWRLTLVISHKANVSRETFVKKWRASVNFRKFYEKSKKKRENEQKNSCKSTKHGSKTIKQVLKKTKTQRSTMGLTSASALRRLNVVRNPCDILFLKNVSRETKCFFRQLWMTAFFWGFLEELARNHLDLMIFACFDAQKSDFKMV